MKHLTEIDHIDPKWEEGRDYQLVCGIDTSENYCERNASLNSSKSNRFLPWRVCADELGGVPIHPGNLCQFLDINTGEWVLEEFMGEWWFNKTKTLCGQHYSGKKTSVTNFSHSPEHQSKAGKAAIEQGHGFGGKPEEERKAISQIANKIQKEVGIGRFNSDFQRELALRPKSEEGRVALIENGKKHKGKKCYNNGIQTIKVSEHPGEGWIEGSLFKWWNNGEVEKKATACPGDGWEKGRLSISKTTR
jgi:hypothetical protein